MHYRMYYIGLPHVIQRVTASVTEGYRPYCIGEHDGKLKEGYNQPGYSFCYMGYGPY